MEEIISVLQKLIANGEAKIEVSFKLIQQEKSEELPKPFNPEGRIMGYRNIAKYMGVSVNKVRHMADLQMIKLYKLGTKYCAYKDELCQKLR